MKKINGNCWLVIATCCCILVSLGYVHLARDMTVKVKDPKHTQFWQLRTVALKWRDAEAEAKQAFLEGNLRPFDATQLVSHADHWIAEGFQIAKPNKARRSTRFASIATNSKHNKMRSHAERVDASHKAYQAAAHDFTLAYNRELNRLMNQR